MIKKIQFIISIALLSLGTQAQILYHETFDNFTLGDVATDRYGQTPGQGGVYLGRNSKYW